MKPSFEKPIIPESYKNKWNSDRLMVPTYVWTLMRLYMVVGILVSVSAVLYFPAIINIPVLIVITILVGGACTLTCLELGLIPPESVGEDDVPNYKFLGWDENYDHRNR